VTIEPFDPRTVSDAEWAAHHDLVASIDAEAVPDDEPMPLAEHIAWVKHGPTHRHCFLWAAWDDERRRMLGVSFFMFWDEPTNRDLGSFWVDVRPEARRRGLGLRLLEPVVETAGVHGRTLLDAFARPGIPAGEPFLDGIGGRLAFTGRVNALDVDAIDLTMLHDWVDRAKERAADYRLDGWDAPCPDDRVESFIGAQSIMNTAPKEDFEVEDEVFTVDQLRKREASWRERKADTWWLAAIHEPTGDIAGYTELTLPGHWPSRAYQGDTGVDPAHRNQGLGRWLKAAMLLRLIDERPAVRRVTTHNAGSNEPMLNINHALGFRCISEHPTYQIPLQSIVARLASR